MQNYEVNLENFAETLREAPICAFGSNVMMPLAI